MSLKQHYTIVYAALFTNQKNMTGIEGIQGTGRYISKDPHSAACKALTGIIKYYRTYIDKDRDIYYAYVILTDGVQEYAFYVYRTVKKHQRSFLNTFGRMRTFKWQNFAREAPILRQEERT